MPYVTFCPFSNGYHIFMSINSRVKQRVLNRRDTSLLPITLLHRPDNSDKSLPSLQAGNDPYCFVEFADRASAENALHTMNKRLCLGKVRRDSASAENALHTMNKRFCLGKVRRDRASAGNALHTMNKRLCLGKVRRDHASAENAAAQ